VVVDGFEVLGLYASPPYPLYFLQGEGYLAYDVLDKSRVIIGLLGEEFFIAALKQRIDRAARGPLRDLDYIFYPDKALKAHADLYNAALVMRALLAYLFRTRAWLRRQPIENSQCLSS